MEWYKSALQKIGDAELDLGAGTFEILFLSSAYTLNAADGGHDFEDDLTGILHRETLTSVTWTNRVFDAANFTLTDPGGGGTATQAVIIKNNGSAATNDLILHDDITDITFDGTNDNVVVNASGLGRIGGA